MNDGHDHEVGYSLLVPFVVTANHGGPFDDAAFVAGWEMGALYQRCALMDAMQIPALLATIRRTNLPQADLIAMHYGKFCWPIEDDPSLGESVTAEWVGIVISIEDANGEVPS